MFKEDRSTFFQNLSLDAVRPSSLVVFHCPDSVLHLFQTGWFPHSLNDGQLRELDQGLKLRRGVPVQKLFIVFLTPVCYCQSILKAMRKALGNGG